MGQANVCAPHGANLLLSQSPVLFIPACAQEWSFAAPAARGVMDTRMTLPTRANPSKKFDQTLAARLRQQLDEDTFINLLKGRALFRDVPPEQFPLGTLEEISRSIDIVRLGKNRALEFAKDSLYEIISGYVKIYDPEPLGAEKGQQDTKHRRALLAWRVPGELLGDFNFACPPENHPDEIVATDDCRLLRIPNETVRNLARSYPQIYLNIARNLAIKAMRARIRAQVLRLPNINGMIAKLFIEFLAERGYDADIGKADKLNVINGTFYIKDIASFLGYKYHRTQSGVHALIEEKLLDHYPKNNKRRGRFVICDETKLRRYVEAQSKISRQNNAQN
jgi:CRP-like cAMP-binding protein